MQYCNLTNQELLSNIMKLTVEVGSVDLIKQQIELSDLRLHDAIKCHTHIVLVQFWKFSVFGISDWVYFWNWWQAVEKMSKDFRKQCSNPVPNCRTTFCIGSLLTIANS